MAATVGPIVTARRGKALQASTFRNIRRLSVGTGLIALNAWLAAGVFNSSAGAPIGDLHYVLVAPSVRLLVVCIGVSAMLLLSLQFVTVRHWRIASPSTPHVDPTAHLTALGWL